RDCACHRGVRDCLILFLGFDQGLLGRDSSVWGCDIHGAITPKGHFVLRISLGLLGRDSSVWGCDIHGAITPKGHFVLRISLGKTISMRNGINLHTICADSLLDVKDSKAYKTYYDFATGKATPKKAGKFKKVASPSRKLSPVLEEEPVKKPKRAKKPAKKSNIVLTIGVAIRDTLSESVTKKNLPAKVDRGKTMDLLSDVALLEAAQLKKTLKKSKLESQKLHTSGSGDEVGSQPKVLDEQEDKTTGTDEETSTKPGVPDVPKYLSKSENKS
nr:hypothetical protein [Tanacetum cinerariifolium]